MWHCAFTSGCLLLSGWAPGTRNPYGIPIGDFLFERRHHSQDVKAAALHETITADDSLRHAKRTTPVSDRILNQLRLSAWARVFRRLQRSVSLTDDQKVAILKRQIAVGVRPPVGSLVPSAAARTAASSGVSLNASRRSAKSRDATGEADRMRASTKSPAHASLNRSRASGRYGPFSPGLSSVPGLSTFGSPAAPVTAQNLSFVDVADDPNFVNYESDESVDNNHRPAPPGEIVVSVRLRPLPWSCAV